MPLFPPHPVWLRQVKMGEDVRPLGRTGPLWVFSGTVTQFC